MTLSQDKSFIQLALRLAQRGYGAVSPNPMVGAVLVKDGKIIGRGWHQKIGGPHGEIEAIRNAQSHGNSIRGATLYVTLEPCCTHGRTPPCTDAIIAAGIKRVVIGAVDPNPKHGGRGHHLLQKAGIEVISGIESHACEALNESFNHWIVHRTPFVTVKAAMTLDGKIATASGESKWITGEKSRAYAMQLRLGADAILAGINTILFDDPSLTVRTQNSKTNIRKSLRRIILDPSARIPLTAKVVCDEHASLTTVVVSELASKKSIATLAKQVRVLPAPLEKSRLKSQPLKIDLQWLMKKLGSENIANLLVEGGGETNALFFTNKAVHRVAFFYAPKILGGIQARKGIAGKVFPIPFKLKQTDFRKLGEDVLLSGRVQ